MTHIPDPLEIMNHQIEMQMELIDIDSKYPCQRCGKKYNPDDMFAATEHPASPLICVSCVPKVDKPHEGG